MRHPKALYAIAAVLLTVPGGLAFAAGAGPSDAQIAHIAYTAGDLDIKAAELALEKVRARRCVRSRTTWCATTRPSTTRRWRS